MHKTSLATFLLLAAGALIPLGAQATMQSNRPTPTRATPARAGNPAHADAASSATDCSAPAQALPKGTSRVFLALRNGKDGSGASLDNARDGSTAEAFDKVLRCYSEGCAGAGSGQKPIGKTENLIVCLGPGTFYTLGNYDYLAGVPHKSQQGFTVGKGWKIHGAGQDKTTLKLSAYLPNTAASNPRQFPLNTAIGLVLSTNSDDASEVEISGLTIDANYPELKARARQSGITALTLEAIHLRSDQGGHHIHDVKVINVEGEIGGIDIKWEAFPVWIVSINNPSPTRNGGNVIEKVSMSQSFGKTGCAITVANAMAEVRHNEVNGYPIGYGGWKMEQVYFHDNTATDTEYGFNVDSLPNTEVRIEGNRIVHPRKYGIVVGGDAPFTNFKILNNTLLINQSGVIGLYFRGNVSGAVVAGNTFTVENSKAGKSTAIQSTALRGDAGPSRDNSYQGNQITAGMKIVFQPGRGREQNCFFQNHDEHGAPLRDLPENHNGPCVAERATKP